MFPKNAWYAVAWSHEAGRALFARRVCNEPLVLYRQENGTPVALRDLCWHRQLPLSKGTLVGDQVQCGYHGLRFDCSGRCVHIPAQATISPHARVRRYPVADKHRLLWVWMGAEDAADPALIPDLHWLDNSGWSGAGNTHHVRCDYRLILDNLLDLTHETYVHPSTIGHESITEAPIDTRVENGDVIVSRWMLGQTPPPFWAGEIGTDLPCDRWQIVRWQAPSTIVIDVGVALAGTGAPDGNRSRGITGMVLNTATPETETTSWYFFGFCRDYKLDEADRTQRLIDGVTGIFREDVAVLNAQQQALLDNPGARLANLAIDAGSVHVRRLLDQRIRMEAEGTPAAA